MYRRLIANNIRTFMKRSNTSRKSRYAKSRGFTTRRPRGRRAILQKYNVHMYKRFAVTETLAITSGVYASNRVFKLSDVVSSSELTALYDQYKITGVKMMIRLNSNPDAATIPGSATVTNTTNTYPSLWITRDYDNISAESISDLQQRNTTKTVVLKPDKNFTMFIRPAVLNQLYLDGVSPATSPLWDQWLDCSTTGVPHYGVKYAFDPNGANANAWSIRIEYVYYLKFKNVR